MTVLFRCPDPTRPLRADEALVEVPEEDVVLSREERVEAPSAPDARFELKGAAAREASARCLLIFEDTLCAILG